MLSWGINDNAALGRRTTRETGVDAEVYETEPMPVEGLGPQGRGPLAGPLPEGGKEGDVETFRATRVAAGDSVSVALNDRGEVRVWGSFRVSATGRRCHASLAHSCRDPFLVPVAEVYPSLPY